MVHERLKFQANMVHVDSSELDIRVPPETLGDGLHRGFESPAALADRQVLNELSFFFRCGRSALSPLNRDFKRFAAHDRFVQEGPKTFAGKSTWTLKKQPINPAMNSSVFVIRPVARRTLPCTGIHVAWHRGRGVGTAATRCRRGLIEIFVGQGAPSAARAAPPRRSRRAPR